MPSAASFSSTCFWAAIALAHQARSCASVAYRTLASFWPTDGVDSTTIIRDPVGTAARGSPTRPRQLPADEAATVPPPPGEAAITPNATAIPTSARTATLRGRTRIERKVVGVRDGIRVSRGRGDHRRVVGAERQRCERSVRERRAQRGVRCDAADDGDPIGAGRVDALHEGAHDRPLVARRQIGTPSGELVLAQLSDGVQQRGLEPGEREVEAWNAGDREVVRLRIAFTREQVELTA